jgi:hypothetical protein
MIPGHTFTEKFTIIHVFLGISARFSLTGNFVEPMQITGKNKNIPYYFRFHRN